MSSSARSVTRWIASLKAGCPDAAQQLWNRYAARLVELARQKLGDAPRRVADEEDVALSVFHSLCTGAARGNFTQLTDRQDLWCLLIAITRQKVVDQIRRQTRQKRGAGDVRGDSVFLALDEDGRPAAFDQLVGDEPTPAFLAAMNEEHERLLGQLRDDTLRKVAVWRMEGYTNAEIAEKLSVAPGTVERKLRLIRNRWSRELDDE